MTRFNRPRRNHCWARSCRGSSAHGCNGSDLYRSRRCRRGRARAVSLRRCIRPGGQQERRDRGGGLRPSSSSYGGVAGWPNSLRRQRTAPLRVERMLERAVPRRPRPPPPTGATLSRRSGHSLVAHLRARHQTDPLHPTLTHTIDADELAAKAGYSRRTRCIAAGRIFMSALGGADGTTGRAASR
ncbi:56kDa selenium binding family protein [Mycobacterium xenopi 4042]|uniref:56kDa selenium binding family protein n=1 Tax=Mycobacterium xenopi 4042 TaxID=1299334 RepID=X8AJF1_MYCXE|nr:56kDa selenium binding family protein [Mycobacterium xenopi 4042]